MPLSPHRYLVKWEGYDVSENTWEPEDHILNDDLITDFVKEWEASGAGPAAISSVNDTATTTECSERLLRPQSEPYRGPSQPANRPTKPCVELAFSPSIDKANQPLRSTWICTLK